MTVYLARREYDYRPTIIHKYMNPELSLRSIVRSKKPGYERGKLHKVFENKLKQDFTANKVNQKWCTDVTYLFLANHEFRFKRREESGVHGHLKLWTPLFSENGILGQKFSDSSASKAQGRRNCYKVYKIFGMRYLKKGYIYDKIEEIYGNKFRV